jgi:hypothetical protein
MLIKLAVIPTEISDIAESGLCYLQTLSSPFLNYKVLTAPSHIDPPSPYAAELVLEGNGTKELV